DATLVAAGPAGFLLVPAEIVRLLQMFFLFSETDIVQQQICVYVLYGSTTENALLHMAIAAGMDVVQLRQHYPLLRMQHRAENRNFMSTLHTNQHGQLLAVKGSPNEVLAMCSWRVQHGQVAPLTED